MEFLIVFLLICPIAAAKVASSKGRDGMGWAFAGLLLGPIGLLAACGAGDRIQQDALKRIAAAQEELG
jgi:hypothetical protein